MPAITELELKKELDKNQIRPLYFLYGEEKYLLKKAARRIMKKSGNQDFPEFNMNEFSDDAGVDSISDAVEALPMMAERKCVAVSDFNLDAKNTTELAKLTELLTNLPETTALIFYYPTMEMSIKKTAKLKKVFEAVQGEGCVVEFKHRSSSDLAKLLINQAEKQGCSLSRQNAGKIVEYVGMDIQSLMSELAKLTAYADGSEITADIIEKLVSKNLDTTVFVLSNAVTSGSYERAYECMDQLFKDREEPVAILSALSSVYIDMYRVWTARREGLPPKSASEYGEYRGREFRLTKADRSLSDISGNSIYKSLKILLETDIALKSSKVKPRILMDSLIARLLLTAREDKLD